MKKIPYVLNSGGIPYLLMKVRMAEGALYDFGQGRIVSFPGGKSASRAEVRRVFLNKELVDFVYRQQRINSYANATVFKNRIHLGCVSFLGENFLKLREWALGEES